MSESEMKRLGDYIRIVDVRNKDLKVEKLLGAGISKKFRSCGNVTPQLIESIRADLQSARYERESSDGKTTLKV